MYLTIEESKLQELEIEVTSDGFIIWIKEDADNPKSRHWLIDGSCLKEDGILHIGAKIETHRYGTEFNKSTNEVRLIDKKL